MDSDSVPVCNLCGKEISVYFDGKIQSKCGCDVSHHIALHNETDAYIVWFMSTPDKVWKYRLDKQDSTLKRFYKQNDIDGNLD